MMKTSRFWLTRNSGAKNLLVKATNVNEFLPLHGFTSRCGISTSGQIDGINSPKTYANFSIFKGKAALFVAPILPKFSKINDFGSRLEKNGVVLLTFMPAIGLRKYDSQKKQAFALSPTEVGCLISLGPDESAEFFHDPSMKSSLEGQVKKTLQISPNDAGYFFSLNILNSIQKTTERFSLPVTKAEFAVMKTAFSFVLPHLMGWDQIVVPLSSSGVPQSAVSLRQSMNNMQKPLSPELEWSR